jgi:hypothetical protein
MVHFDYPDSIVEDTPLIWESGQWKVEVWTDAFSGSLVWVHFMSCLTGGDAWRIASSLANTFNTRVRIMTEDETIIYESYL